MRPVEGVRLIMTEDGVRAEVYGEGTAIPSPSPSGRVGFSIGGGGGSARGSLGTGDRDGRSLVRRAAGAGGVDEPPPTPHCPSDLEPT
jgi:hypothetical protein